MIRRIYSGFVLIQLSQCLIPHFANAQAGAIDSSFADQGIFLFSVPGNVTTNGTGIELQSDGKYVICGKAANQTPSTSTFVAVRLNDDGTLDQSFGTEGYSSHNVFDRSFAHDLGLQQDGKILITGQDFDNVSVTENIGVMRLKTDGSLDSSFGDGGRVAIDYGWTEEGHTIIQQPDGKIILTGHTDYDLPSNTIETKKTNIFVARLLADGDPDPAFGTNGFYTIDINNASSDFSKNMLLNDDGKMICSGSTSTNGNQDALLVRINSNGGLDSTFGINGIAQNIFGHESVYWRMAWQADGKIVVAGQTIFNGLNYDFLVQRFNDDGSIDNSFGADGSFTMQLGQKAEKFEDVAIQSDGKIICAGYSANSENNGAIGDAVVIRLNSDGTLDSLFDSDGVLVKSIVSGFDETKACLIDQDGNIVVAGYAHNQTTSGGSIFAFRLLNDVCSSSYSISPSGATTFCKGGKVKLTVSPDADSYQWLRNGAQIPGATAPDYTAKLTGNYSCMVTGECGTSNTNSIAVVQNPLPKAIITPSGIVNLCEGQEIKLKANTGVGISYQWYKNAIMISGATNAVYKANEAGDYYVVTTNSSGCTRHSSNTTIQITCKAEIPSEEVLTLFPNPGQGLFSVRFFCKEDCSAILKVTDLSGKLVFEKNISASKGINETYVDLTHNLPGSYLLELKIDREEYYRLIMLQ